MTNSLLVVQYIRTVDPPESCDHSANNIPTPHLGVRAIQLRSEQNQYPPLLSGQHQKEALPCPTTVGFIISHAHNKTVPVNPVFFCPRDPARYPPYMLKPTTPMATVGDTCNTPVTHRIFSGYSITMVSRDICSSLRGNPKGDVCVHVRHMTGYGPVPWELCTIAGHGWSLAADCGAFSPSTSMVSMCRSLYIMNRHRVPTRMQPRTQRRSVIVVSDSLFLFRVTMT